MDLHGECLILVADGRRARLFEERWRGGPLIEITDRLGDLTMHAPRASGHAGRVHDRHGAASHTTHEAAPHDRDELRFATAAAGRLDEMLRTRPFDELVLMASPRALGRLRSTLSDALQARLRGTEPRERVGQTVEEIRAALHDLRLRSA